MFIYLFFLPVRLVRPDPRRRKFMQLLLYSLNSPTYIAVKYHCYI